MIFCESQRDKEEWDLQAVRFPKDTWEADEARSWCREHDGTFEAASGGGEGAETDGKPRGSSAPETASGDAGESKGKGAEKPMPDEQVVEELQARLTEGEEAIAAVREALTAKETELDEKVAELAKVSEAETAWRAHEVAELERLAGLTGNEANLEAYRDLAGKDLAEMTVEKLLGLKEAWTKANDEQRPKTQSSPADESEEPPVAQDGDLRTSALN